MELDLSPFHYPPPLAFAHLQQPPPGGGGGSGGGGGGFRWWGGGGVQVGGCSDAGFSGGCIQVGGGGGFSGGGGRSKGANVKGIKGEQRGKREFRFRNELGRTLALQSFRITQLINAEILA